MLTDCVILIATASLALNSLKNKMKGDFSDAVVKESMLPLQRAGFNPGPGN